jgi:hypothetical protein
MFLKKLIFNDPCYILYDFIYLLAKRIRPKHKTEGSIMKQKVYNLTSKKDFSSPK